MMSKETIWWAVDYVQAHPITVDNLLPYSSWIDQALNESSETGHSSLQAISFFWFVNY